MCVWYAHVVSLLLGARADFPPITVQAPTDPFEVKFKPLQRRHDWCSVWKEHMMHSGGNVSLSLIDMLAGKDLSVLVRLPPEKPYWKASPWLKFDDATHQITGGYLPEVFYEMERRGKFTWRNSVWASAFINKSSAETNDEWLLWAIDNFDVVVDWYWITVDRRNVGVRFLYPFIDLNAQLVGQVHEVSPRSFDILFSFLRPWQPSLWFVLILSFVMTAMGYRYIESSNSELDSLESIWQTVGSFTGSAGFEPKTGVGKVFAISWAFTMLLALSSYTANLASMLVVQHGREGVKINSLEDAIEKQAPICVVRSDPSEDIMRTHFPDVPLLLVKNKWNALREKRCAAVYETKTTWDVKRGSPMFNPKCDYGRIGPTFFDASASFAMKVDARDKCTDIMADLLTLLMHNISQTGYFKDAQAKYLVMDHNCPDAKTAGSDAPGWAEGGGMFMLHGVVSLVCILVVLGSSYCSKSSRDSEQSSLLHSEESEDSDESSHALGDSPASRTNSVASSQHRRPSTAHKVARLPHHG